MNIENGFCSSYAITPRPPYQFRSLSVPMRWEVTRRHAIYQIYWSDSFESLSDDPYLQELRLLMQSASTIILGMIGFSGPAIPPETDFNDIGCDPLPTWMAGCVHPITFKGLVGILLRHLPSEVLSEIADLFQQASSNRTEMKYEALQHLVDLNAEELNAYPDDLFVSLSPTASVRRLNLDLNTLLKAYRERTKIPEQRDREDSYRAALHVWDLREGWSEGRYHNGNEQTLSAIAADLGESLPTVNNRYRRAFELITGYGYSPELWFRVFGPLKFHGYKDISDVLNSRPRRSPSPREIPDAAISFGDHSSFVAEYSTESNADYIEMQLELRELLATNLTDEEIAERIGTNKIDLIGEYRRRFGDRPGS
ncbi:hypothetical protein FYZ48_20425 [Gimesia chilikensis]|uniref:hypothetical protein n=1 Tax=Gimesia chilikensis TaxID=2605989 RepID=UPI0011EFA128|nr:hypothetical protein [Gimesia chilikensis]KAA0134461.1 hypothetical protein FYZ48_20425 [Gimesia chilikensis]